MLHAQPRICPGERNTQTLLGILDTNGSPNLGQTTRPSNNQQQIRRTSRIVDFAVLADHWVKLKESEKKDKYLDLGRELKKLWNMKGTVILIVIGALGTVTKGLVQGQKDLEIKGQVKIIQTTASARILRRVLKTWGDFLSHKLQWETIG